MYSCTISYPWRSGLGGGEKTETYTITGSPEDIGKVIGQHVERALKGGADKPITLIPTGPWNIHDAAELLARGA